MEWFEIKWFINYIKNRRINFIKDKVNSYIMAPRKKDIFDLYLELDEALQPKDVLEFVEYFKGFTDKRYQPNCLHLFYEVIVMVFFAILGGCNTFSKCELFCDAHKE